MPPVENKSLMTFANFGSPWFSLTQQSNFTVLSNCFYYLLHPAALRCPELHLSLGLDLSLSSFFLSLALWF